MTPTISFPLAARADAPTPRTLGDDLAMTLGAFAVATPVVLFALLCAGDALYRRHVVDVMDDAVRSNAFRPAAVSDAAIRRITREAVPGAEVRIDRMQTAGGQCVSLHYTVVYPRLFPVPTWSSPASRDRVERTVAFCAP